MRLVYASTGGYVSDGTCIADASAPQTSTPGGAVAVVMTMLLDLLRRPRILALPPGRTTCEAARRAATVDPWSDLRAEETAEMAIVLRKVAGIDWGWFAREDQRMHVQPVSREHSSLGYKAWLEDDGAWCFLPEGMKPAVRDALRAAVDANRERLCAEWVHFMITKGWIRLDRVAPSALLLTAYPGSNHERQVRVDVATHCGGNAVIATGFVERGFGFDHETCTIEIGDRQQQSRCLHIEVAPLVIRYP